MSSTSDHGNASDRGEEADQITRNSGVNPLALPYPWWYGLYQRIKLIPWWLRYKLGTTKEAVLEDKILEVASSMGLQKRWVSRVLKYAIAEFSKKGLGPDYYGYHSIEHELEATYFTLLAAKGLESRFRHHDLYYLFVSALFHDFDPHKEFDKPNEDAVEWFLRHDYKIPRFIEDAGIDIDIVMALIHRTAYPFKGEIKEKALNRMQELFTSAGIPEDHLERRHYEELGWFLSVSERIAGYALGDFTRAVELAKRNAHALGWHPSVINIESVKYFGIMDQEMEMVDLVLKSVSQEYRTRFQDNVASFKEAWNREMEIRDLVLKKKISVMHVVEEMRTIGRKSAALGPDPDLRENILRLYMLLPPPIRISEKKFRESLLLDDTLLVTLRIDDEHGPVVGYAKGGPLERYRLRRGTFDENMGSRNTIYLEPMSIEPGYWGANGGHLLRRAFLNEAKKRGYRFVSAYTHRNVIERRIARGEPIEMVCKYDPDKLDCYRLDLLELTEDDLQASSVASSLEESMREEQNI